MFGALEDFKIIIYVDCSETVVCVAGVRNLILFISWILIVTDYTVYISNAHAICKIFYILFIHMLVDISNNSGVINV